MILILAVYIHNERSIQSNIFCSQILSSNAIVSFLGENCISWGFDVTNLNNKQRMYSQVIITHVMSRILINSILG